MEKAEFTSRDILRWEDKQPEGFHGILTNPLGERGFLSKIHGGTTWMKIGENQDEAEVIRVAKALHDAMSSTRRVNADSLRYLGQEVERLSRPKTSEK